jgi:hypothetical protein
MKLFAPHDDRTALGNIIRGDWRKIYYYPFIHKITWSSILDLFRPNATDATYVGLRASIEKGGFRNDGSYRWATRIDNPDEL